MKILIFRRAMLILAICVCGSCATNRYAANDQEIRVSDGDMAGQASAKVSGSTKDPNAVIDKPVAIFTYIKTEVIGLYWFRNQVRILETQLDKPASIAERKSLLDGIINDRILIQAAVNEGITVSESEIESGLAQFKLPYERDYGRKITLDELRVVVEKQQEDTGISWEELLDKMKNRMLMEKLVRAKGKSDSEARSVPTESEIRDYYTENKTRFVSPEMIRFKHIFVLTKGLSEERKSALAKKLAEVDDDLRKNPQFDRYKDIFLAGETQSIGSLEVSVWRKDNSEKKYTYGDEFFSAVFALAPGVTSGVLESKLGLHIVQLITKYPFRVLGLSDKIPPDNILTVREYISGVLGEIGFQETAKDKRDRVVAELRKQTAVTIYEENLHF
jgi:peptidyl-prolyl cis-trans isomerase SurA